MNDFQVYKLNGYINIETKVIFPFFKKKRTCDLFR